ncbi:putative lipase [Aspergillus clavatus NRRL 1]|uniref:Lipase, putative n=1 Tax=Aspergillus clavatus (strain ATCC 1007 / CBS 513.65 / DSM 816 / NCTC 3887 / NRRL 1 / QM 1276 / 107) TaxID=344612 RepID=A1C6T5_ASPCL|nr:lipase, putative [Aspergillus clavatus NRRL 1]EAW14106.1 lipase, putative [Aspergillus clavatus NRRL 1]
MDRGSKHGPPLVRKLSSRLSEKLTVWQTTVVVFLWLYVSRNFAKIVGLESPEPLANLYSRSFFRATWIVTALDAGFWTAMKIKPNWLRDIASLVFTAYYLFAAEQADDKVRRVRATLTVEHLRVSWNKGTTPYLWALQKLLRPRFTRYPPRAIRIPRPKQSVYNEPTEAWLYFDGPLSALRDQTCLILDVPGGGYVAMDPRSSEDKLLAWAGKTKVPILSLNYKKAPEYPYPYALNECYDVYHTIVSTCGRCLGLSGRTQPRIVVTGDSAGGNLAVGTVLMVLQSGTTDAPRWQGENVLPRPEGLVLAYPSLNMRVESWMTEEQMSLIQDKNTRQTNRNVLQRKNMDYQRLTPFASPGPSAEDLGQDFLIDADLEANNLAEKASKRMAEKLGQDNLVSQTAALAENQPKQIRTRLAVSSMISYVHDRILTPEMMRAMIILYIGSHNRPDFSTDFLLSPVLAPESLLTRFPKTYIITGERDPLVDDTVIFAGRLRQAKLQQFRERQELGLEKSHRAFNEKDHVEVSLLPGVSHGFLQMAGFFSESWKHINRCATWINELFDTSRAEKSTSTLLQSLYDNPTVYKTLTAEGMDGASPRNHKRSLTGESSADEDRPLEMGVARMTPLATGCANRGGGEPLQGKIDDSPDDTFRDGIYSVPEVKSPMADGRKRSASRGRTPRSGLGGRRHLAPNTLILPLSSANLPDDLESPVQIHNRERSLHSLPSHEDLLDRRMNGLAGGLMGIGEGAQTP